MIRQAAAADDPVVQADLRALVQALQKGDWPAAEKFLDKDFSWIDSKGIMWAEDDAAQVKLKPLIGDAAAATITEHKYGKVVFLQENVGNNYVAHFWVERPAGWRLLHTNEINIDPSLAVREVRPNFAVPCVNPSPDAPVSAADAQQKKPRWRDGSIRKQAPGIMTRISARIFARCIRKTECSRRKQNAWQQPPGRSGGPRSSITARR